jgi:5-methyltetrahydropteroyltriglutamate--homocysteine methyltransferase
VQHSTQRILTTHTGSLPRPPEILEAFADGGPSEELLAGAVRDVVRRQADTGVDVVGDGEFGKPTDTTNDADHGHGVWALYVRERLTGFEWVDGEKASPSSKDRSAFPAFYGSGGRRQPAEGGRAGEVGTTAQVFTCTGPIAYCGQELVARDIAHLKAALDGSDAAGAFLPAVSPGSLPSLIPDRHHRDEDAYRQALASALREEYLAIADAGLTLQIDDPVLVAAWDFWPDDDLDAYRAVARRDVELLNEALRGIPTEQIRYHLCWGSWQGPHRSDLPLADVLDLMLEIRAGAYLVEAANAQHEHEWKLWRDAALPDGATLIPGVVTHKTSVVEHPEVVADRIVRYAELVGRERVMAGTDCGLGGRISSDVAWAKLDALVEGARLASERLSTR